MILHASTKMDISNYFDWLIGRLNAGYFDREVNNKVINRIWLKNIEKIYLYTKTPSKIYRNRDLLENYNVRLITFLTQYDHFFEPRIKDKEKITRCIKRCRKQFSENYFGYGPIFYTEQHDMEWHLAQFDYLCHEMAAYTDGVYLRFDINERCQKAKNMTCRPLDYAEQNLIISKMKEIAEKHRLKIEIMRFEEDFDTNEIDIGEINCCPHACAYCKYITNASGATAKYKMLNSASSILYGFISNGQKIKDIDVDEIKEEGIQTEEQVSLFDLMT